MWKLAHMLMNVDPFKPLKNNQLLKNRFFSLKKIEYYPVKLRKQGSQAMQTNCIVQPYITMPFEKQIKVKINRIFLYTSSLNPQN